MQPLTLHSSAAEGMQAGTLAKNRYATEAGSKALTICISKSSVHPISGGCRAAIPVQCGHCGSVGCSAEICV